MTNGLEITLNVLGSTRNEAAAAMLIRALDASSDAISQGALRALLQRRSAAGQRELVARWHKLSPRWKDIIVDNPGRLSAAIRDAVLSQDPQLGANGCDAVLRLREYDLIPALINAVEAKDTPNADLAAATLIELAELLHDELAGTRELQNRRSPQLLRAQVVRALELGVQRFAEHGRREIVEAFLILTGRDNATLRRVLREPLDRCHRTMIECLTRSPRRGVLRLLLSYVDAPRAPRAAINVLAHRQDAQFLQLLMRKIGYEPSPNARANLRRLTKIDWLRDMTCLKALDDAGQHSAVQLVKSSGLGRPEVVEVLRFLLTHGKPGGRRAAAAALAEFPGADTNQLVLRALRDEDARVHATALAQLRQRGLPGAMATLVEAIDNPHEVVRQAARSCLADFNLGRYLSAYDSLDDEVRRSTGRLVKKVDVEASRRLAEEMKALARRRRIRALEMAQSMDLVEQLETQVHELLNDEDHMVRVEAATALAQCPTARTQAALRDALLDSSIAVRNAAERSLRLLVEGIPPASPEELDLGTVCLLDLPQSTSRFRY